MDQLGVVADDDDDDASSRRVRVQVQHQDFLSTTPADFPTVTSILLDPSCSGSGLYARSDHHQAAARTAEGDESKDTDHDRLQKLSNFQITALRHAMSFPAVQRIVYSTCSVHRQENEAVVAACLRHDDNDNGKNNNWEVVAPVCLETWARRGLPNDSSIDPSAAAALTEEETKALIRVQQEDDTNGFFVCCLQRKAAAAATRKKKKKQTGMVGWRNPNLDLGIPIYNGEFAAALSSSSGQKEIEATAAATSSSETAAVARAPKAVGGQLQPKAKDSVVSSNDKMKGKSNGDNDSSRPVHKKRDKKLEWKRKQREQKLLRLNKAKSK